MTNKFFNRSVDEFWSNLCLDQNYKNILITLKTLIILSTNETDFYICGGFFRRCLEGQDLRSYVGDIDVFCKSENQYEKIKEVFDKNCISSKKTKYTYTYTIKLCAEYKPFEIQLICSPGHMFRKSIEELLNSFDYSCNMIGFHAEKIYYNSNTLTNIKRKSLFFNKHYGAFTGVSSVFLLQRYEKFIKMGYSLINPKDFLEMLVSNQSSNADTYYEF